MRDKLHGVEHLYLENFGKPIEVVAASVGFVVATSDDADEHAFPLNTNVLVHGYNQIGKAGTGVLATALKDVYEQQPSLLVVVRVESDADANRQTSKLIGAIDNESNSFTGMQLALAAESLLGITPRLFIAPEFSHIEAVGKALESIAKKLRGIPIIEGQSDGLSAAVQDRRKYDEAIFIDPGIEVFDVTAEANVKRGGSAAALGHIIRNDYERGYHTSPSNQLMYNIKGPSVPVDFVKGSKTCMANVLSASDICCAVRKKGGVYFWGNRLANGVLIPHQRLRYIIGDSILDAHQEYVDENLTSDYVKFVKGRVNNLIRRFVLEGKIAGGECWIDAELNKVAFADNTAFWDYKLGFYNVAETMIFRQSVTDEYNNDIVDRIAA